MSKTLIMVTNTSAAWGFRDLAHEEFSLLKEFSHPESRQKGVDLLSDRPGQGSAKGGTRCIFST
ncbi:MAG: hypothetical protein ACI8UC_000133 [Psychromonas sp.]|jgi:hypothetical protein